MSASSSSADSPENLDISPGIAVDLNGLTWLSHCVRSLEIEDGHTSGEHLVLVYPGSHESPRELALPDSRPIPVRIHSECLLGDVFNSSRCDCRDQLSRSLELIEEFGRGILIYLRQEGRGIGLYNKLLTFGVPHPDSFTRNEMIGLPADKRRYDLAAKVLVAFGISSVMLITGNPAKIAALEAAGIRTSVMPCAIPSDLSREAVSELASKIQRGYRYATQAARQEHDHGE